MSILPFFALGLRRYGHKGDFVYLSSFIALSIAVFSAILYGSTRFRLPLEPFFIVFAAAFISEQIERRGLRQVFAMVGFVAVCNLLIWWQQEPLRQLVLSALDYLQLR
jgi:hypothetical protein